MSNQLQKTQKNDNFRKLRPSADVYESSNAWLVVLDMPGVDRDNVTLSLEQDSLKISARRDAGLSDPIVYEREFGIPNTVSREGVSAKLDAGVLSVTLPKHEAYQPRRIPVNAN